MIPRHINTMISYIYKGHNLKVMNQGKIVDVRETFKEMQLAMDFQTPILKYFYPLESDIVSGVNLKKSSQMFRDKKIVFSKNIVHFDGIKLESLEDIQKERHHKFWCDDQGALQANIEDNIYIKTDKNEKKSGEEKKDEGGKRVGDNNET